MDTKQLIEFVSGAFELAGVAILTVGAVWAGGRALRDMVAGGRGASGETVYQRLRTDLGRTILIGLEVLVAADIIRTVGVSPTFQGVAVLGLIVLIRTFLSFSLEVEIEGKLPWQRERHRHAED